MRVKLARRGLRQRRGLSLGLGAIACSVGLLMPTPSPAKHHLAAKHPAVPELLTANSHLTAPEHLTAQSPTAKQSTSTCPQDINALVEQLMLDLPSYSNRIIQRRRGHLGSPGSPAQLYTIAAGQAEVQSLDSQDKDAQDHRSTASQAPSNSPSNLGSQRSKLPPLPSDSPRPSPRRSDASPQSPILYEIFFTTLERQYLKAARLDHAATTTEILQDATRSFQQFHWLILSYDPGRPGSEQPKRATPAKPWRVISLRSQLADYPAEATALSPARNALKGPVAQAITLWLNDLQLSHRCLMF